MIKILFICFLLFLNSFILFSSNFYNKDEYLKSKNKDELILFYEEKYSLKENYILKELEKIYSRTDDEIVINFLNNLNLDRDEKNEYYFYYIYLIGKKCSTITCKMRLKKFYDMIYDETDDIEIYSTILLYEELFNKKEKEEIIEILDKNNSMILLNYNNIKQNVTKNSEEINLYSFNIKNKKYNILLEKNFKNYKIKLLWRDDVEKIYLYINQKNKIYLKEIKNLGLFGAKTLDLKDINNDGKEEIIIQNTLNNIFNEIYIFSVKKNMLLEFNSKSIDISNYYYEEKNEDIWNRTVWDDFGNKITIENRLPNKSEYSSLLIEPNRRKTFFILNDKIYMRFKNIANFEIILDYKMNKKLKIVDNKNIKLSTSF